MKTSQATYHDCHGCSLCLLVCPVWHATHDVRFTPKGRARALQQQAKITDITDSVLSCTLCGACNPACPQGIDCVDMTLKLRRDILYHGSNKDRLHAIQKVLAAAMQTVPMAYNLLFAGKSLAHQPEILKQVEKLLGILKTDTNSWRIIECVEIGLDMTHQQHQAYIKVLKELPSPIVADGSLIPILQRWLPNHNIIGLGYALSQLKSIRHELRPSDFYFIESRAYHTKIHEYQNYYTQLRKTVGCEMNLDLQRLAQSIDEISLPASMASIDQQRAEQIQRIIHSKLITRIVVESAEDYATLTKYSKTPVVHLSELAA